jgi:hypothetical protein
VPIVKAELSKVQRRQNKQFGRAQRQASRQAAVTCVLCGVPVPAGHMLEHKASAHGETPIVPSPAKPHHSVWTSICQGGLPSLGKRSR